MTGVLKHRSSPILMDTHGVAALNAGSSSMPSGPTVPALSSVANTQRISLQQLQMSGALLAQTPGLPLPALGVGTVVLETGNPMSLSGGSPSQSTLPSQKAALSIIPAVAAAGVSGGDLSLAEKPGSGYGSRRSPTSTPLAQIHMHNNTPSAVPTAANVARHSSSPEVSAGSGRSPSPLYSALPASVQYPPLPSSNSSSTLYPARVMSPEPEATLSRSNSKRGSELVDDTSDAGQKRRSVDRRTPPASQCRRKCVKPFRSPSRSSPNPGFKELPPSVALPLLPTLDQLPKDGPVRIITHLSHIQENGVAPPSLNFSHGVIKLDVFNMYRARPRSLLFDKTLQRRLREMRAKKQDLWADPAEVTSVPKETARKARERERDRERRERERVRDRPLHNVLYQQRTASGELVLTSGRARMRSSNDLHHASSVTRSGSSEMRTFGDDPTAEVESGSTGSETRRDSLSDDQGGVALTKIPKRRGRKPNLTRVAAIALHQGSVNITGLAGIANLINSVTSGSNEDGEQSADLLTEAQRKSSLAALVRLQSRPEETAGAPMVSWKGTPLPVTPDMIGFALLTSEERRICSILRLYPEQYLKIKETLLTAKETRGFFKKREAQKMCRVDVNKTAKIYDWFIALGWLPFGEVRPEEL